ncbi:MAG: cupredoxin domain-containing protein [Chloroflexi bacterium]|nr:cupredoxin domain-containing protein [Chloroflexota bacterium]
MKRTASNRFFSVAVALVAIILAACRADMPQENEARGGDNRADGDGAINVVARDFSFALDVSQAEAGTVTFVVDNHGTMPHDFAFKGSGVEQKTPIIQPGETARLTVELQPGTYTYLCTIPGHEQLGMKGTFTVTASD